MNWNLHPKTQKVLECLQAKRRRKPTMQEIADQLGMKRLEVINQVIQLRRMGFIKGQKQSQWSSAYPNPVKVVKDQPEPSRDYSMFEERKTPLRAVRDLLKFETFEGTLWDPACGAGEMSSTLEAKFGERVRLTDISSGVDFLTSKLRSDAIISHPPLRLSKEFADKALELANKKVALWLGLYFLEEARQLADHGMALKSVYIPEVKEPPKPIHPTVRKFVELPTMAWFVWEKGHVGSARLNWL